MQRDFKGIWIPASIYLDTDLSWTEKILLVEIDSLDRNSKGCFASNKHLAKFVGKSEGRVANIITSLKKRGYVKEAFSDGHNRAIKITMNLHENVNEPSRKREKNLHENVNEPSRKREHSNTVVIQKSINKDQFESFWNKYNYKVGKAKALKAFQKLNASQIDELFKKLPKWLKSVRDKDQKYWPHPATFLNGHRWNDEVEQTRTTTTSIYRPYIPTYLQSHKAG